MQWTWLSTPVSEEEACEEVTCDEFMEKHVMGYAPSSRTRTAEAFHAIAIHWGSGPGAWPGTIIHGGRADPFYTDAKRHKPDPP
jgi:hypothetical protein